MRYQDQLFQQRESAILDAALQLFSEQPWDRVTIAQVAIAAGIGKGTVYKHFPSKEALYTQLAARLAQDHLAALHATKAAQPPGQALRPVIRLAFEHMLNTPLLAQLSHHCDRPEFQERLEPAFREQFKQIEGAYTLFFQDLLRDSLSHLQLNDDECMQLLWGVEACFNGVMARIAAGGFSHWAEPIALHDYFDCVTDFIIAGLCGQANALRPTALSHE